MACVRTQVYLRPEQHAFLKAEAEKRGTSLTELLRRILDEYVQHARPSADYMKIVALGRSGQGKISAQHDKFIARALMRKHVR